MFLNNHQQKSIEPIVKFDEDAALAQLDSLSEVELMTVVERSLELMTDLSDAGKKRLSELLNMGEPPSNE